MELIGTILESTVTLVVVGAIPFLVMAIIGQGTKEATKF